MVKAVVFDLWGTLITWPEEASRGVRERWAARLGVPLEHLDELWHAAGPYEERESGPLRPMLESMAAKLGNDRLVDELVAWRVDLARTALAPTAATVDALIELRRRDLRLGLVSNCTEDIALAWPESRFAALFDAAVFSATAACLKPDPAIYRLALAELRIEPSDCLFVGDGANGELEGAARVGMTPVLIHPPGEDPPWDGLKDWSGLRITSIPQVLDLVA
jgi:putative hydrolase of the HAD superfamily